MSQTPTVVLPTDGSSTQSSAPQGAFRYQRGFYLITPQEMMSRGLMNNDTINCIGFTIGEAQSDTTKGKFKVYLQNTSNSVSRSDTTWTVKPGINTNYYNSTDIFPGNYEWQVKSNCSPFSSINNFSSINSDSCQTPTNLKTNSISSSSASLTWVGPAVGAIGYDIEYKSTDSVNWNKYSTVMTSYVLNSLLPNKQYNWRVKSKCATDSSDYVYLNFYTESVDVCTDPFMLMVPFTNDTSAKLLWIDSAADYYSVRFRRLGTSTWISIISFTDSILINFGLSAGTTYEWQVRSICGTDSVGQYVQGPNFVTTGATVCYAPDYFSVDSITASSAKFVWDQVPGATSYELRYRAKNVISWDHAINPLASPMVLVHDDSICIPDQIGPYYVTFKGTTIDTFVYSGGGVYVAWEYQDSFGTLSTLNSSLSTKANTALVGSMGQDSISYLMSFITPGDSSALGLDTVLNSIQYRPETRLCSPSLRDSVEVLSVYALGKNAPSYTSYPVSALIRNYSSVPQPFTVDMTVKDVVTNTVRYTESKNLLVGSDTTGLVEFTGWTPNLIETDSIIISVAGLSGENVLSNNRNHYVQMVTQNVVSYADGSADITEAGTDTLAGLTLSRHLMNGCGKLNSVQVFLTRSSIGHSVHAIALDTTNAILAESLPFVPDSSQVNQYHTFYFVGTRLLTNEKYYVGLAQTASVNGYFPVGVQYEGGQIRDSAYWRGRITGDSIWHQPMPGRLMIRVELIPGIALPYISGGPFLCSGATDTLIASSIEARYADSVIAFSSQIGTIAYGAQQALGTPDVYPSYEINPSAWVSATDTGKAYLVLRFSNPDSVNFVDIFETYNPGSVDSVYLRDEVGVFHLVSSGTAAIQPPTARRNRIVFPLTNYKVTAVRVAFNLGFVPGINAIDAVSIGKIKTPGVFGSILWNGPGGFTSSDDTIATATPGKYKLTITNTNGCTASDSLILITPIRDTANIFIRGDISQNISDTVLCPNDSIWLKSDKIGNNFWKAVALPSVVLSVSDSLLVKNAGLYYVIYDDGTGCGTTLSDTIMVSFFSPAVINISGDTVICPGTFTTLYASPGFASYNWSTSAVTDSIVVNDDATYIVSVVDLNGCKASDTAITTIGALPIPIITGNLIFCPEDSTTLHANAGFTTYLWSTGATTDSIRVKTESTFQVTVSNVDGCINSTSVSTYLFNPPAAMILSNDGFCPMDSVELTGTGGDSYLWSTGSTAETIFVNTVGSYLLTVTDANGCKDTVSKNIIQFTSPVPFISGTLSFCGGSVTTLNAGLGYNSYLWSTGETSNSILVSNVGSYSVTVTDNNGCSGSTSVNVTQNGSIPAIPGPISGNVSGMCNTFTPSTYSVAPVLNSTCYIWRVPKGVTIVDGFMADSNVFFNTIKVVFDNTFIGGLIEVASHNDCGASATWQGSSLYVSASPGSVPGIISGPTSGVCKLGMASYSLPPITTAITYNWIVPLGAMILSGQGTPSISVFFASSYRTGDICVQYSTDCGTSPFSCINVSPGPRIDSTITGPNVVCASATNIMYSIPPSDGATDYTWTVPTGAAILSGQGTNQIKVAFGTHAGIVTVTASNVCGTSTNQFLSVALGSCIQYPSNRIANESIQSGIQMNVFPNPSEGIVHMKIDSKEISKTGLIQITDAVGRIVYTYHLSDIKHSSIDLDLQSLNKGMYFISLKTEIESAITKLILR